MQVVEITTGEIIDRRHLIQTKRFITAAQFLRNWVFVSAAGAELALMQADHTHRVVERLGPMFYVQVVALLSAGGVFYYCLAKFWTYRIITCLWKNEEIRISLLITLHPFSIATMSLLLIAHCLPAVLLISLKTFTLREVFAVATSDTGLSTRWSFIATQTRMTCSVFGLLVMFVVGEVLSWRMPYQAWVWQLMAALVDTVVQLTVVGELNRELAMAKAAIVRKGNKKSKKPACRKFYTWLAKPLCTCYPKWPKLFVYPVESK
ncbi:unnamed protein product [Mesocestoides corti]|uniref:TLC domain-containing protein n=1 Tax=Mesocestoides corti TaxID=53468 RepID=A0A0R3UHB3_MESCO|nr:unnamed protein product [Mesocestoides corti]